MAWDEDKDGLIENGGFPDQTYDCWVMSGPRYEYECESARCRSASSHKYTPYAFFPSFLSRRNLCGAIFLNPSELPTNPVFDPPPLPTLFPKILP